MKLDVKDFERKMQKSIEAYENELKTIIEKNNCGIFTKAGDKVAFTDAILKLYKDRELCKEYGRNGREFIMNNLTREIGTRKYVEVIKGLGTL